MRNITLRLMLLALLLPLVPGIAQTTEPQAGMKIGTMTAADLEKAGDLARTHKDWDTAIDYFRAAIRRSPKNALLYNKMGLAQLQSEDLAGARASFERASKINPSYVEAVNNIGAVEYKRKNYKAATKYFKKAVALEETRATFHVNLGAAWFSQKKLDRAIAEYTRAMELDPEAFRTENKTGIAAQIASPEERAQYSYLLAKAYAKRGDVDGCLQCLKKAKEDGYRNLANVYKDEEFSQLRGNPKLHEVVPPPSAK
jgi:tetratricopeptide (TPR) repeat protein